MHAKVEEHWSRVVREDEQPRRLEDFGFNLPVNYVLETGEIYVQTHYQVMPEPGGWNDQDELWCKDMLTYLRGRARALWLYGEERKANDSPTLDGQSRATGAGKNSGKDVELKFG